MSNIIIKPPKTFKSIFLAGSIEMGAAENWQERLEREIEDWVILNPRRDDWDSSWVQSIDNPQFYAQVEWELSGIEKADLVIFYFDPNTKSPITLMELGIASQLKPEQILVCCPEGFWRKGNVDILCHLYGIDNQAGNIEDLIDRIRIYNV